MVVDSDLAASLSEALGNLAAIEDLRRLSGGASRETWSFVAVSAEQRRRLILQRVRGGMTMGGPSLTAEDALLAAAERAGVPVPRVVVDAAGCEPFLGAARITGHVDGEALGPRIVRREEFAPARSVLAGQCGRALAAIHSIDPADVPGLEDVDTLGRLRDGLDLLDEHRPAFELALRWLHDNRPADRPLSVVHGDFRIGNLLVDPGDGLQAVLDWELAHLGDPLEDLGWLCVRAWRFGGEGEVGGVAPLADLLDAYADASGAPVSADDVRWWIVAGNLTWGLICAVQAHRHLDGHVRSVELATIGRRICETEYDLLDLLGIAPPGPPPAPHAPPAPPAPPAEVGVEVSGYGALPHQLRSGEQAGHGRPTADELIEAVREHLGDVVGPQLDGAAAFQLKVAANALGIVQRELVAEPTSSLTAADELQLAEQIRAGRVPEHDELAQIRAAVVDRVRVANPTWLLPPDA